MLQITPIPAFSDNYIWLLRQENSPLVAVVDPGDAAPVLEVLAAKKLTLGAILVTHHHADHVGGVKALLAAYPGAMLYDPAELSVIATPVWDGDQISLPGMELALKVMTVPGHTAGHVAYHGGGMLFCGDTLFAAGCGRVFDGTMEQMAASLDRIAALPADTQIYCAHEYTLSNLGFARLVEPDNASIVRRLEETTALRAMNQPSVPSRLALELETNPFLRTRVPAVVAQAEKWAGHALADACSVFSALRTWKDEEYD